MTNGKLEQAQSLFQDANFSQCVMNKIRDDPFNRLVLVQVLPQKSPGSAATLKIYASNW